LVDTSRHFLPVPFLHRIIDMMAIHKLNVFHWHIVDAVSFPAQSRTFPLLAEKGAYVSSSQAFIYSTEDMVEIVQYARLRGVRVVPEFDTPDHATSWSQVRS